MNPRWTLLALGAVAIAHGCQVAAQVDRKKIPSQGGAPAQGGAAGAGGTGGSGGSFVCDPARCPGEDSDCRSRVCQDDACAFEDRRAGAACTDPAVPEARLCDGFGNCVECLGERDCPAEEPVCWQNSCLVATCGDMLHNGQETDVDCGGPRCAGCENGSGCAMASDCASGFCQGTGGAPVCAPCVNNTDCPPGQSCASGVCG